jgi:hypothetical protein
MSAVVTSDENEDWFTNSHTWAIIIERAQDGLTSNDKKEFEEHVNTIGIDFTLIDKEKRRQISRWLLQSVEALCGPAGAEEGWDNEVNKNHLKALAVMLRRMM